MVEPGAVSSESGLYLLGVKPRRGEASWLTALRGRAQRSLDTLPWPTAQEEEWRRSDLSEIDFNQFRALDPEDNPHLELKINSGDGFSGEARFLNGSCRKLELSSESHRRDVRLLPFNALGDVRSEEIALQTLQGILENGVQTLDNRFLAWHFSSLSHGIFLYVPAFAEIEDPFLVELTEAGDGRVSAPHVTIVLGRGARAKVILRTKGPRGRAGVQENDGFRARPLEISTADRKWGAFVNLGIDLVVGEAAALEFYHLQNLPMDSLTVVHSASGLERDGHLKTFEAALGSGLLKSRFDSNLNGNGCEAYLNGIYLSTGRQHLDLRTVQRHRAPRTISRAFYKGALRDRSRSIYQGLIKVSAEASKTDAFLTNRNLILSDGSRADSIPSLQIDTSDVKCSHGAATGKLNEDQLFYLMSRGLGREEAAQMLVLGYFEELLASTPRQFAAYVRKLIGVRIGSNGNRETNPTGSSSRSALTDEEARNRLLRKGIDAGR